MKKTDNERKSFVTRNTNETKINVEVYLDGKGVNSINTGLPFFDHMIQQLSKHSLIDIKLHCLGDLQIDSQALAPSNIPTSRNSASHFDIGRSNNNTTESGSDGVQGRNSIAQTIDNPNDLGLDIDHTQNLRRAIEKIDRLEGALNELKASHNDIQKKVNLGGGHRRRSSMQRNSVTSPPK